MALVTLINAPSRNVNTLYTGYYETDAIVTCLDNAGVALSTSAFPVDTSNGSTYGRGHCIATPQYTASVVITRAGATVSSASVAPEDYNANVYYAYRWSSGWSITDMAQPQLTANALTAENTHRVKTAAFIHASISVNVSNGSGDYAAPYDYGGYYNGYPWWSKYFEDNGHYIYYHALYESYVLGIGGPPNYPPEIGLADYRSTTPTNPIGQWVRQDISVGWLATPPFPSTPSPFLEGFEVSIT